MTGKTEEKLAFAQVSKATGAITYLYDDDLGSVVFTADDSGAPVSSYAYDAYGKVTSQTGDTSAHAVTPFAFAGEYLDKDTGLYNLRARWYDPQNGPFLSLDPAIAITGEAYSYASGNPISLTDPLGLLTWGDAGQFGLGALDGLTGGLSTTALDAWAPGIVDHCSGAFGWGATAGTVASFFVPGGAVVHAVGVVAHVAVIAVTASKLATVGSHVLLGAAAVTRSQRAVIAVSKVAEVGLTQAKAETRILAAAQEPVIKAPTGKGYVYFRKNLVTNQGYVGKAKSSERFVARQAEHDRKEGVKHDYTILGRADDDQLARMEEYLLRVGGGPSNSTNVNAVLANKIYARVDVKYQALGGDF